MELELIPGSVVLKPMDYTAIEEREEITFHMEKKSFSLDYGECMRIHDDHILEMMAERDEMD